jgi:phenylacetate-CoA ligase
VDLARGRLRIGLFGAEPWSAAMRTEIEAQLGLKAIDVYGLSEIMGPGVACECECRQGLHAWEDHFLFEVIDPETGDPVPEGQAGELVITTLTKEALPMVRYRTRDITRMTTQRCECGRTHARILRIAGRNDDMLIIRGVNVYPSQIEAVLVGRAHLSPHYQLVVRREGILDTVSIEVEAQPGVDSETFAHVAREVVHHVKVHVGITTSVTVLAPGSIARSQGKAVRVRDLRPKEL